MPVYTRKGDEGQTYLANGLKVSKDHLRVNVYGAVDELNSTIGLAAAYLRTEQAEELYAELCRQQHLLFELGAELAAYKKEAKLSKDPKAIGPQTEVICSQDTQNLEASIDRMEAKLEPMRNFILPGGTLASGALHLARSVCRRLERQMTKVMYEYNNQDEEQKRVIQKEAYRYINRLSDYLFTAARYANSLAGCPDINWQKRDSESK